MCYAVSDSVNNDERTPAMTRTACTLTHGLTCETVLRNADAAALLESAGMTTHVTAHGALYVRDGNGDWITAPTTMHAVAAWIA